MLDIKQAHVTTTWQLPSPLINVRFSPLGQSVFVSTEDSAITRFQLPGGERVSFTDHESWVFGLALTPDGQTLISTGGDGRIIWWPATADVPTATRSVVGHAGWIRAVSISPDGQLLATGGNDKVLKIWSIATGELLKELPGHESDIYSVAFHPSGQFVLSGELKGHVRQWDWQAGQQARLFDATKLYNYNAGQAVNYGGVRSMAWSADGQLFCCAGLHNAPNPFAGVNDPLAMRFRWDSQEVLRNHTAGDLKGVVWRARFLSDGTLMGLSGGQGGGVLLFWNGEQDADFHRFVLPNTAREADLHPDGLQVATAHFDRQLRITRLAAPAPAA